MIGLSRTEHEGNPRVGGLERRDYARSGETWGKWGNEQNKTRRRKKEKKGHTR